VSLPDIALAVPEVAPRVLVVDDDPGTRQTLGRTLRRLGYEVSEVENGEQGLELAVGLRPHVILSDLRMPQMDGHTLLRRLAAHDLEAAVIVMSGSEDMDDVIDVLHNGAVDYIRKPWGASELIAAVARAVGIHDQRQSARQAKLAGAAAGAGPTATSTLANPSAAPEIFEIVEELQRAEAITLPPLSAVLADLRSLVSDPRAGMSDIVAFLERDPSLAAQVLAVSNVQYAGVRRSVDLSTALRRIGLGHMHTLVHTVISHGTLLATDATLGDLQRRIWRYSVARAISMRALAELAGAAAHLDPETAYLAGLMADAGANLLLWICDERIANGSRPPAGQECPAGLREHHQEVGAALLGRWGMDPIVQQVAEMHHLEAPPAPPNAYWNLAILGAALVDGLDVGDDPTRSARPTAELVDRCGAELQLGSAVASKISSSVRRELNGVMEALC
jgi:DNA-binding response OmpR family regulator/HD-like signal output (HDOD) protein